MKMSIKKTVVVQLTLVEADDGTGVATYRFTPVIDGMIWYLPVGLIVWGATEESFLTSINSGGKEAIVNGEPLCALFFASGRSFEQIEYLALAKGVALPKWFKFDLVKPGTTFEVKVRGPVRSMATWGALWLEGKGA